MRWGLMMVYVRIIVRRESTANDNEEGIQNVPMYEIKGELRESTLSGLNHRDRDEDEQRDRQIKIIKTERSQDKTERLAASSTALLSFLPSKKCIHKSHLIHTLWKRDTFTVSHPAFGWTIFHPHPQPTTHSVSNPRHPPCHRLRTSSDDATMSLI
jgi:hypothetical protein